jgi:hypothetical protein
VLGADTRPVDAGVLRLEATNYAFAAPRSLSDVGAVRLVNRGAEPHYALLFRIDSTRTLADFLAWRAQHAPAPPWLTMLTGPGPVSPGDSADVELVLAPGRYVVMCGYPAADRTQHVDKGMLTLVEVRPTRPSPANRATTWTRRIALTDSAFRLDAPARAGRVRIAFANAGTSVKQALLVRLPPGGSVDDETRWFDSGFVGVRPGAPAGGVLRLAPGETVVATVTLRPGRYAVLSHTAGPWQSLTFDVVR